MSFCHTCPLFLCKIKAVCRLAWLMGSKRILWGLTNTNAVGAG